MAFKADVSTIIENDCAAMFFALVCFATISTPAWNAEALFQVLVEVLAHHGVIDFQSPFSACIGADHHFITLFQE